MTVRHVFRPSNRTPEEAAKLVADRERYQREKPTPEQLLAEGGHDRFVTMGELLQIHQIAFALRAVRNRQRVTLAELERRTGIDQAALSRIENGKNANPTLDTLYRLAQALGLEIQFSFQEAAESHGDDSSGTTEGVIQQSTHSPPEKKVRRVKPRGTATKAREGRRQVSST